MNYEATPARQLGDPLRYSMDMKFKAQMALTGALRGKTFSQINSVFDTNLSPHRMVRDTTLRHALGRRCQRV